MKSTIQSWVTAGTPTNSDLPYKQLQVSVLLCNGHKQFRSERLVNYFATQPETEQDYLDSVEAALWKQTATEILKAYDRY